MNNFNHELLMFFETLLDDSKYIYIRKSLNRDDAQEYCSEKYENGALCSFKTDRSAWEDLIDTTRSRERKDDSYWTGLKRTKKNGTWYFEFSDGTCTDFAKTQACKGSQVTLCQDDQCRCFYMHDANFRCSSCTWRVNILFARSIKVTKFIVDYHTCDKTF
jgi:hypothetical protein